MLVLIGEDGERREFASKDALLSFLTKDSASDSESFPGIMSLPPTYRQQALWLVKDWNAWVKSVLDGNKASPSEYFPSCRVFGSQLVSAFKKAHKDLKDVYGPQEEREYWRFCIKMLHSRREDAWIKDNGCLLHLIRQNQRYGERFI